MVRSLLPAVLFAIAGALLAAESLPAFDHSAYTGILREYVDGQGMVDYGGLKARGRTHLDLYVAGLAAADPSRMSPGEKMALYINAYNAFTLKLVVDHYPVASIRKIPGLSGILGLGQWSREMWVLAGETISLNTLEHEMIRPMGDPRIHFALVCAARSCPPLAGTAYTAGALEEMFEEQARAFNQSPKGLRASLERGWLGEAPVLRLSSIYRWFKKDFLVTAKDLPEFVLRYAGPEERAFILRHREDLKIEYLDYDWSLNAQP